MLPAWLPKTLEGAIEYYRKIHSADVSDEALIEAKRQLVLGDLFYLLVYPLKRRDMVHPWLFDRCREVQAEPNNCLDLWAREHRKTTCITYGLTIQDILNDPEITICIFSHTRPIAKGLMRPIKREFESNDELKQLFPNILWENPHKDSPQWSEDSGIVVKRKSNPKEATLEAHGLVDGQPTSKHFKLRIYDDVVTRESVTTPEQIAKTSEALELSDNLGMEGGWTRFIGTRYSLFDTYSILLKRDIAKPRLYPATHNGKMDGKPVFFSQEEWERRLKTQSRSIIAAQLLQNPLADSDATFQPLWLKSWETRPRMINVAILVDPNRKIGASNDNCSFVVQAIGGTGVKFLVDGYCHKMTQSQRWTALRDLHKKWSGTMGVQNIQVAYEKYGAEQDLDYFEERMKIEKYFFVIQPVSWTREGTKGEQGKTVRIERLEPDFRNGRFLLPYAILHDSKPCVWKVDDDAESKTFQNIIYSEVENLTKQQVRVIEEGNADLVCKAIKRYDENSKVYDLTEKFIQEYLYFPFGEYKDALDAASRIYDLEINPPVMMSPGTGEPEQFHDS